MRSKAIFVALLALAFGAQAAHVSQEDAESAALGWVARGGRFGARIGSLVESAATHTTTNGATFYSVKMYGGGTVFMSSDSEMEPVIAFTDSEGDFSRIDRRSPLWKLLNRDVSERSAEIASRPVVARPTSRTAAWVALIERGDGDSGGIKRALAAGSPRYTAPGDLRVSALVKSKWDQSVAGGDDEVASPLACYNYYTPQDATGVIQEGDTKNAVCGCVATAMGQIMFYHKYPEVAVVPETPDTCWFWKTELKGDNALEVSGEPYDWEAMVAVPAEDEAEEARKAIGHLTADAGRSVGMHYSSDAADGTGSSGSYTFKASKSLTDVFGYGQSVYADQSFVGTLTKAQTVGKVILSNLDAGYPVMLGISGESGGHEIVADGYGYQGDALYVHLNMGWSGAANVWYNLPNIDTRPNAGHVFNTVDDAAYNIIPDGAGLGVMSGRVVDEAGAAFSSATVTVYRAGTQTAVTQLVTSVYGVWGAALPEGDYDVEVESGELKAGIGGIGLLAPVLEEKDLSWKSPDGATENGKYPAAASYSGLGNSWGNDVVLMLPRVRIVVGIETNLYTTLDAAIDGAREIAAAEGIVPVMEILRDVDLGADATVDFDCVLRAATGELSSMLVNRPSGATVTVADGASLVASNCVFQATGRNPLVAAVGGKVFVGPGFAAERVAAEDAFGFNVIDRVTSDIAVECAVATAVGHVFGFATSDDSEALGESALRLYATFDETGETRGGIVETAPGSYRLVWTAAPVPVGSSVGYYVTADGETNAFAKVDILFGMFENARAAGLLDESPEVVLVGRDASGLSFDLVVSSPLTIRGIDSAFLAPAEGSHIVVTNGGSLVVRDVAIGDRTFDTLVHVLDGGSMTLGDGASITNVVCTGNADGAMSGPVAVHGGGTLRLEAGSAIAQCSAIGNSLGGRHGGGVYVHEGGTLDLAGGSVTGCLSQNGYGGGVYSKTGAGIVVSGPSVVSGNLDKDGRADDVYILYGESSPNRIQLLDSAAGGSIGVRYSTAAGNAAGFVFADASALESAHDIEASAEAFFSDANADKVAEADGTDIRWVKAADASAGPQPLDPSNPEEMQRAVARVDYPDGFTKYGETAYWSSVQNAFASLEGASGKATVTLLQDDWFISDIVVPCDVFLVSDGAGAYDLGRLYDASFVVGDGASLTVSNVVFTSLLPVAAADPYFAVSGGSLMFLDGTEVLDVLSDGRFGAAVTVTDGGAFSMFDGSLIAGCTNTYTYASDRTAYAGALLVNGEGSTACLAGGTITNCFARRAGGVCVDNGAEIRISGGASVYGNYVDDETIGNVVVADRSFLVLDDVLTGVVGDRADVGADKALIGTVDEAFPGSDEDLVASAMNFWNDEGEGYGVPVRSEDGSTTLLVWSGRLAVDGTYTDQDGDVYSAVMSALPYPVDVPAEPDLVYNGEEQTGYAPGLGYVLSGTLSATDAGTYDAVATLADGYVWSDGTTEAKPLSWTIRKAEYDMDGVSFEDATFTSDGYPKSIEVSGVLPEGVSVSYFGGGETLPGEYEVTATFVGDDGNYEEIPPMTAILRIVREIAAPAVASLVYNATEQVGVAEGEGYTLSGDVSGVDAGDYVAIATLDDFCVWEDGSSDPLEIEWSIEPAPLTVYAVMGWKRVGMSDPDEFEYTVEGLQGSDAAADVLEGALVREPGEETGAYPIRQGSLDVKKDEPNYVIGSYQHEFFHIISESQEPPSPIAPAKPTPIAFSEILEVEGVWKLTLTGIVEKCWYSLYETDSLSDGFDIGGAVPVEVRQASSADIPEMKFERPSAGAQLFWRALAEPEDAH